MQLFQPVTSIFLIPRTQTTYSEQGRRSGLARIPIFVTVRAVTIVE